MSAFGGKADIAPKKSKCGRSTPPTNVEIGLTFFKSARSLRPSPVALFDEGRKFDRSIFRDFNARCRPSNAHGRDGCVDFHVAGFCNLAGDKSERSFSQAQKS